MEEQRSNGTWVPIIRSNNTPWDTTVTRTFKTEANPQFHDIYISYSSPYEGSQCVKTGDIGRTGKIVLVQGPASQFFQPNATVLYKDIYYGQYVDINFPDDTLNVPLTFVGNEIQFPLISSLQTGKIYHFRLVTQKERLPIDVNDPRLGDVLTSTNDPLTRTKSNDVSKDVLNRTAGDLGRGTSGNNYRNTQFSDDQINQMAQDRIFRHRTAENVFNQRNIIYGFPFKLSKYTTLAAKMNQLVLIDSIVEFKNDSMLISFQTDEAFEEYEVYPRYYQMPGGANGFFPIDVIVGNAITNPNKCSWQKNYYPNEILDNYIDFHEVLTRIHTSGFRVPAGILTYSAANQTNISTTTFKNNNYIVSPLSSFSRMGNYTRYELYNQSNFLAINKDRLRFANIDWQSDNDYFRDPGLEELLRGGARITQGNPPPPPPPTPPAIGTRVYVNYVQFLHIANQFAHVKNKATYLKNNYIYDTRFVSTQMRARINSFYNDQLELPGAGDYFMIYLKRQSNNVNTEYRFRHYYEKAFVQAWLNSFNSGTYVVSTFAVLKQ